MLDLTTVDMIIVGLILFLGLKGLVNGFMKELFSFIGLIGGVIIAARVNTTVGELINNNIFPIENDPALKLAGFVTTLLAIWLVANMFSSLLAGNDDDVGFISRVLGYGISVARYTAIFGLIFASVQDVDLIHKKIEKHAENSHIIQSLEEIGERLLNMQTRQEQSNEKIHLDAYNLDLNETNQTQQ